MLLQGAAPLLLACYMLHSTECQPLNVWAKEQRLLTAAGAACLMVLHIAYSLPLKGRSTPLTGHAMVSEGRYWDV
jgi:hypothetical protein